MTLTTSGASGVKNVKPVTYHAKNSGDTLRFSVVVSSLRAGQTVDVDNLGLTSSS